MKTHHLIHAVVFLSAFGLSSELRAQSTITPVPNHYIEWTGAIDNDFFNPRNWSTGVVPDGVDVAIRLSGDPAIPNKHILANYAGTGDKTIQFFSIQSGANKVYTVEFSGNCVKDIDGNVIEENWLIINPVGRGFTFNGQIGSTGELGMSADITYPYSTGAAANRLQSYYIFDSYSRLTVADSTAAMRQSENGLAQGIFILRGNAQMDLSAYGNQAFIYMSSGSTVVVSPSQNTALIIGGLQTGPETVINLGSLGNVNLNSKMATGEISLMAGVFFSINTANPVCDVYGDITRMTGVVNFMGDGRGNFRIRSGAQYLVDGVHNGNVQALNGACIGGGGVINGNITVDRGGLLTPGWRGSTIGNSPDSPLTINATNFNLQGSIGFDLVRKGAPDVKPIHDRLDINLSGTMTFHTPSYSESPGMANIVVGMADSYARVFPDPVTYELMTINLTTTDAAILGDFEDGITLPASLSVKSSWQWNIDTLWNYELEQLVETKRVLTVTFEQMPFASPAGLEGKYLSAAKIVDEVFATGEVNGALFEALNRQPSIILYEELLDQLTPSTYQSWFPAAVVRTNSMIQNIDDRLHQDAAFKRKKGSFQMFLDAYRQEASRAKNDLAAYANYDTIATVVGADYAIGPNFVAGGFAAYEHTQFDLDTAGGNCNANSFTAGLHARYTMNDFQVNLVASYGTDKYSSKRSVAMTSLASWADADANGTRMALASTLSYTFRIPEWFEITPVFGLQLLDWKADAFQERNANEANLHVHKQNATSQLGTMGIRIARSFPLRHGLLRPFFHYGWLHEFHTDTRTIQADLFGHPLAIEAPAIKPNGFRMDVGLDWNLSRKIRVNLRYHSEYRGAVNENVGLRAGVNYSF